jgi:O-antigen ligase
MTFADWIKNGTIWPSGWWFWLAAFLLGTVTALAGLWATTLLLWPLLLLAGFMLWRRPHLGLLAYIVLLPIHSLTLTVLLVNGRLPVTAVRLIAAWKETLLIVLLCFVILYLLSNQLPVRLIWVDWVALAWLSFIIITLVFHDVFFDEPTTIVVKLYGARDWLLYLAPYFIGRFIILSPIQQRRILKTILHIGFITSLIGLIEYLFIPTEWHVVLGVPRYFSEILGTTYPAHQLGLPENYWIHIGQRLRRSVSTHLSAQAFAMPFLIIMPVVVYNLYTRLSRFYLLILLVCTLALLFTITRMTIFVCFLQALLMLWLLRRRWQITAVCLSTLLIFTLALGLSPDFRQYIINTVTLNDSSTQVRPRQWADGWRDLVDNPLGHGLGSTGRTGGRFTDRGEVGSEAGYLKVTGALGWPGLLLFLFWFGGIIFICWQATTTTTGYAQGVVMVTLVTAVGFLLNNLTAPPDQSPFTIYVFGWLAGLSIQLATALRLTHAANHPGNIRLELQ